VSDAFLRLGQGREVVPERERREEELVRVALPRGSRLEVDLERDQIRPERALDRMNLGGGRGAGGEGVAVARLDVEAARAGRRDRQDRRPQRDDGPRPPSCEHGDGADDVSRASRDLAHVPVEGAEERSADGKGEAEGEHRARRTAETEPSEERRCAGER
jgi:hypothetical protein